MKRYYDVMRKVENAGGIYDTAKYRYVIRYGFHKELFRIRKEDLNTTAALSGWKKIYTEF